MCSQRIMQAIYLNFATFFRSHPLNHINSEGLEQRLNRLLRERRQLFLLSTVKIISTDRLLAYIFAQAQRTPPQLLLDSALKLVAYFNSSALVSVPVWCDCCGPRWNEPRQIHLIYTRSALLGVCFSKSCIHSTSNLLTPNTKSEK